MNARTTSRARRPRAFEPPALNPERLRPPAHTRPAWDLRLVPPALGVWLTCLVGVHSPAWASAILACAALSAAVTVALLAQRRSTRHGVDRAHRTTGHPRHRDTPTQTLTRALVLALAATAAAGMVVAVHVDQRDRALAPLPDGSSVVALLRVDEDPRPLDAGPFDQRPRVLVRATLLQAQVRGETVPVGQPVTLLAPDSWAGQPLGVVVSARVRHGPTDPGDASALLLRTTEEPTQVSAPPAHLRLAQHLRSTLRATTDPLPAHARALLPGIAVGDDRAMDPAMTEEVRVTGLTHITAVSGAHVAMVLAPVILTTGALRPRTRVTLCAGVLLALVVLVRPEPSVIRASLMGLVTIGALLTGRPASAPTSLSLTVAAVLLVDPWLAAAYGFVLSVAATAALALLAPSWTRVLARLLPTPLAAAIATTAAAQIACGPILVLLDARVSLVAVPANALAAPAVPAVTMLGLAATLLGPPAPLLAGACAWAATPFTWWIAAIAQVLAGLPLATVPWASGPVGAVALAAVSILLVAIAPASSRWALRRAARSAEVGAARLDRLAHQPPWRRRQVVVLVAAGVTVAVALVMVAVRAPLPGRSLDWQVAHCDVGQGSAMLVRTGEHSAILLDAGPAPEHGGDVRACLDKADVRHLDLLLLTHTHADHAGGTDAVLQAVTIADAAVGPGPGRVDLLERLHDAGAAERQAGPGDAWRVGRGDRQVQVQILQGHTADLPDGAGEDQINGNSLVALLTLPGGARVLVAGDLGEVDQDRLVRDHAGLLAGVEVVAVPHHGSVDQSARLARLTAPQVALVSVGENDYGHPTASALELYRGASVRRTDQCGTTLVQGVPRAEDGPRGDDGPHPEDEDRAPVRLLVQDRCD